MSAVLGKELFAFSGMAVGAFYCPPESSRLALRRPATNMPDNSTDLSIAQALEGWHDPPGATFPDGGEKERILHRALKAGQGQRDTHPTLAVEAVAGRAVSLIETGAIRRRIGSDTEQSPAK